ncbi:hypothetical protein [Ligilactobacillus agilis]|uniref:hypothetical protein n=1 Tax=Ligilactobacillus agilis TaxID=1601 RepID=UPI000B8D31D9|nr:hypothetical protein [Ligilactobacillus agilis]ASR40297.1 hypothetical protein BEN83_01660 [Ligilactobacillus agilis]
MEKLKFAFGMYIWISIITIIGLIFYGSGNTIWSLFADVKILLAVLVLMIMVMLIYLTALWVVDKFFDLKCTARVDSRVVKDQVKVKAKGSPSEMLGILAKSIISIAKQFKLTDDEILEIVKVTLKDED